MKAFLTLSFFLTLLSPAATQDEEGQEYQAYLIRASKYVEDGDYGKAIDEYIGARTYIPANEDVETRTYAPEEIYLDHHIRTTLDMWVQELDDARRSAVTARGEAMRQKDTALVKGIQAQAFRIALRSDLTVEDRPKEALYLAYRAKQDLGPNRFPQVEKAFGQAVYYAMSDTFKFDSEVIFFEFIPNTDLALTILKDQSLHLVKYVDCLSPRIDSIASPISTVAVSPKGDKILIGSADASLIMIDVGRLQPKKLKGHTDEIVHAAFSKTGERSVTCARDRRAILWDSKDSLIMSVVHSRHIHEARICPSNPDIFLTRDARGVVYIRKYPDTSSYTIKHGAYIYSADFSPDGTKILTTSIDGTVRISDLTGTNLDSSYHKAPVRNGTFSKPGDKILTTSIDHTAKFRTTDGNHLGSYSFDSDITSAAFHKSGYLGMTSTKDGLLTVFDLSDIRATRRSSVMLNSPASWVFFSQPDASILITSLDGKSQLLDMDGHSLMELDLGTTPFCPSSFSPDGKYIITHEGTKSIRICPTPTFAFYEIDRRSLFTKDEMDNYIQKHQITDFKILGGNQ